MNSKSSLFGAFIAGLLFAIGLGISGMTQPSKVSGILDVFGNWDPSLMFVMVGAIGIHFLAYRVKQRQARPLWDVAFQMPAKTQIDRPLVLGAAVFGIGWAMGGYCPGPALVSVMTGRWEALLFVASMIAGMFCYQLVHQRDELESTSESPGIL